MSWSRHTWPAILAAAALSLLLSAAGCARVKPYEREHLARRSMTEDREASEVRFEQHARGSREGADGGTGQAGGGCGCN
jgi:hypothetical protein